MPPGRRKGQKYILLYTAWKRDSAKNRCRKAGGLQSPVETFRLFLSWRTNVGNNLRVLRI
jgi:hypothetical protein